MKHTKILTGSSILLLLASCGAAQNPSDNTDPSQNLTTNTETMTGTTSSWSVVLNLNHPLAGKTLNFQVEIVKIDKWEGNTETDTVQVGDSIEVNYIGTLEDGEEFDNSYTRGQPLPFVVGAGQMIPGFDSAVVGMKLDEKKDITIAPADAYGEYDASLTKSVPKSELQSFVNAGYKLEAGETLPTQFGPVEIIEVTDE